MRQILKIYLSFLGKIKKYAKNKLIIKIHQFTSYIILKKKLPLQLTKEMANEITTMSLINQSPN